MSNPTREPPDDRRSDTESSDETTDRTEYSRRSVLKTVGVGAGLTAFGTSTATVAQSAEDYWTLVAIPDTQFYSETDRLAAFAREQTQWVVDNLDSERIEFVSHEGDLVENGDDTDEWDRIDTAMSTLDGAVPYSTLPGNHDWAELWNKDSSIQNYLDTFGPSRFEGESWFGGSSPNGLNTYQTFSGGGYEFLHLALEFEPRGSVDEPDTPLGWAQSVIDDHPDHPVILTTHSYLKDSGGRVGYVQSDDDAGNSSETVWEEFVEPNPQIFMVLNGHWTVSDGEEHQVSTNEAGLPVYEMVADYQDRDNGGDGWLRLVQFVPGGGSDGEDRVQVKSYSPHYDEYETDENSEFSFDLDFSERFSSDAWTTTKGDVDGDGDVDADDVELIQRDVADQDVDIDREAADVDGDGDVDVGDVIATRNKIEGR
jgi:hypothetical protein